jgi:hypothetical protein
MHPPLTPGNHPLCLDVITALKACHTANPFAKLLGACNDQKSALDACFRAEVREQVPVSAQRHCSCVARASARDQPEDSPSCGKSCLSPRNPSLLSLSAEASEAQGEPREGEAVAGASGSTPGADVLTGER